MILTICEGNKRDLSEDLRDISDFLLPLGLLIVGVASPWVNPEPYKCRYSTVYETFDLHISMQIKVGK